MVGAAGSLEREQLQAMEVVREVVREKAMDEFPCAGQEDQLKSAHL